MKSSILTNYKPKFGRFCTKEYRIRSGFSEILSITSQLSLECN